MVASNFENNRENYNRELRMFKLLLLLFLFFFIIIIIIIIIPFSISACCLVVIRDGPKTCSE